MDREVSCCSGRGFASSVPYATHRYVVIDTCMSITCLTHTSTCQMRPGLRNRHAQRVLQSVNEVGNVLNRGALVAYRRYRPGLNEVWKD
jgi:hypothetical protein